MCAHNLGRGLSELLKDDYDDESSNGVRHVSIKSVSPNPYQPRKNFIDESVKSLSESIKSKGILQPLLVRSDGNNYQLIAGERRLRAAQMAGLTEVPVIVYELSDIEILEAAILENIQREDLNPLDEAEGYLRLIEEFGHTQEKISQITGKSRSHIANILRIISLSEYVKKLIREGHISLGHAKILVGCEGQDDIAQKIVKDGMSVRQVEKLMKSSKKHTIPYREAMDSDEISDQLSKLLNMKVTMSLQGEGGVVQIHFKDLSELDDLLKKLSN